MTSHAESFIADWKYGKEIFPISTSGSTGIPKTIHIRREQMINSARKTARALKLTPGMNALVCLDTRYIAGMMMLVRSMEVGMNAIVTEPSANPLATLRNGPRIDFVALVPYQLQHIIAAGDEALLKYATTIIGGAPIPYNLEARLRTIEGAFYATFGMTETISHVALQKLNGDDVQDCFHGLAGVSFSTDERGCLTIDTDYLDNTIITNDLADLRSVGEFRWLGRYDNIINTGGLKVMPEKVERVFADWIMQQGINLRYFVSSLPHPMLGQEVVLVIEGEEDLKAAEIIQFLAGRLNRYEVPKRVIYRRKFRETATGKVDRQASLANEV